MVVADELRSQNLGDALLEVLVLDCFSVIGEDLCCLKDVVWVFTVLKFVEMELLALFAHHVVLLFKFGILSVLEVIDLDEVVARHFVLLGCDACLEDITFLQVYDLAYVGQCALELCVV